MATTNSRAALDVSRRNFLRLCAAASGASLVSLDPRAALAAEPKKGGTLRVGFYIEAATMDPHLSGSKIDRQVSHNFYEPLVTFEYGIDQDDANDRACKRTFPGGDLEGFLVVID